METVKIIAKKIDNRRLHSPGSKYVFHQSYLIMDIDGEYEECWINDNDFKVLDIYDNCEMYIEMEINKCIEYLEKNM